MKKIWTLILVINYYSVVSVMAQTARRDSIVKIGVKDGRNLHLSHLEQMRFKEDKDNYISDLFKPSAATSSDTALLKDSVYVKAFRMAAFKKAHERKPGHYFLIGGIILVGIYAIILTIASLTASAYTNVITQLR